MATITKAPRDSNFELLRIVCLILIIAGHMVMYHDFSTEAVRENIRCIVRPFFCVAVNCFVLISGWYGIKYSFKKILGLARTTWFWAFFICAIALVFGIHELQLRDVRMLIPIISKQYWFITVYIVLCLLSPLLNIIVDECDQRLYGRLLLVMIVLFVAIPSLGAVLNFSSITGDNGYGIVNFSLLYLLGRYMRLYHRPMRSAWTYLAAYFVLLGLCGLGQKIITMVMGFEFTALISYDTFFVFFGAVAFFCFFSRLNFKSRLINALAKFCFACYIIHIHPWTGKYLFEHVLGMDRTSDYEFVCWLFVLPALVFVGCALAEWTRKSLTDLLVRLSHGRE